MNIHAIITAAGQGIRLGADTPKPLIKIKGKPVLVYSAEVFAQSDLITGIIVTAPAEKIPEFEQALKEAALKKPVRVVPGGKTRQESVANALAALDPNTDIVAVHDAARPLLSLTVLEAVIRESSLTKAAIVAVPVKSTIKRIERESKNIDTTLDRRILWEAQTPQVFAYELLTQAHRQGVGLDATDDAFLVERFGCKIKVVEGEYKNIKITTPEDLKIVEALIS